MRTKTNILVVDDDSNLRKALSDILRIKGYAPTTIGQGKEALDRIREEKPVVALIDLKLEDMSGLELMKTIKARSPDTECILLTGYASQASAIEAVNSGAYGYVQKPYDMDQLLMTIRRAIEKQETETALRESEALYHDLVITSQDLIWRCDTEGRFTFLNPAWEKTHGYQVEEMLGKPFTAFQTPEVAARDVQEFGKHLAGGSVIGYETTHISKSGDKIHLVFNAMPLYDTTGRILGTQGTAYNITERKQAEEGQSKALAKALQATRALQESEERFQQVVVSISDHIYVTEITEAGNHINRYLSHHIETLTGYAMEKFLADWSFWSSTVIHPDDKATAATQLEQLTAGQNSETEYRLIRADGEVVWIRDSARVQSRGASKIIYGLVSNITERKQVEEEIRKLNEDLEQRVADRMRELSTLYEVTAMASESFDLQTTLEWSLGQVLVATRSNMGAIHMLNEAGDLFCLTTHQGIPPNIVLQLDSMPLEGSLPGWVLKRRKPLVVSDLGADRRTDQMVRIEGLHFYAGAPMQVRGQVLGILSIFGQAGQRLNVEEVTLLATIADQAGIAVENARLRRQAEQAAIMEERGRLARELHDSVTQSLYSLSLFADWGHELLKTGDLKAVKQRLVRISQIAQQSLKEMRLLIYELRPAALEQDGLRGALQQRLDAVEKRVGVEARLLAEPSLKLPAPVEEGLYRIAQEALNNALNHAVAASITVRIATTDKQVVLEVVDDGVGFELDTTSNKGGMGLRSMRERAERFGGVLTVVSTPGEGTTVKVSVEQESP